MTDPPNGGPPNDGPPGGDSSDRGSTDGRPPHDGTTDVTPQFPERLGPCRLIRPLGKKGGQGIVYLAKMVECQFLLTESRLIFARQQEYLFLINQSMIRVWRRYQYSI